MVTFDALRHSDPLAWHSTARQLRALAATLDRRAAAVAGVRSGLATVWDGGPAAPAARAAVARHAQQLTVSSSALFAAANVFDRYAAAVADCRARLQAAIDLTHTESCTV